MAIIKSAIIKYIVAAHLLLSAAVAFGQAPPQAQTPANKKPGIAVRSEVVLVPTVVTNHAGAHVSDLTQNDFTILENGQPQKIAFFQHIQTAVQPTEQATLPAGEFKNSPGTRSDRSAILVLDLLNSSITEQSSARDELMKFLSGSPTLTEPVCLVAFDAEGVRLIHDFTKNPQLLAEALTNTDGHRGPKDTPNTNPLDSAFRGVQGWHSKSGTRNAAAIKGRQDVLQNAMANRAGDVGLRVWLTLEALREIGEAYSGIPGRKSLVWATGGFPFQIDDAAYFGRYERELMPAYESVWRTLDKANIAVYPLDVEDLISPAYVGPNIGNPLPQHFDTLPNVSNMESFAEATGGKLCDRQTTALGCFTAAADDSSDYYLIGFYETSGSSTPGWRKLAVKISRPDMRVRARSGYYVRGPQDETLSRKDDIELALASPLDFTAVPLTVRLTTITSSSDKKKVGFVFILPRGIATIDETDSNHVNLDFAALARSADGSPAAVFSQNLEGKLKPEGVTTLKSQGLSYPASIDLPAGEYTVRFVIRDNVSGQVGSTSASLNIP
ncbi:MAG TPA: VWA domain-containing protein [Terriglobales bacterium]|nr:VWA domain-containing protein [Terriglobales bacterium]